MRVSCRARNTTLIKRQQLENAFKQFFEKGTKDEFLRFAPYSIRRAIPSSFPCAETDDRQLGHPTARTIPDDGSETAWLLGAVERHGRSETSHRGGLCGVGTFACADGVAGQSASCRQDGAGVYAGKRTETNGAF